MFGIGSMELLVILAVALIALGPKSLAGLSRSLGRAVGEFRRVSTEFQRALNAEAARDERNRRSGGEGAGNGAAGGGGRENSSAADRSDGNGRQ